MNASELETFGDLFADALREIVSIVSGFALCVASVEPDDGFHGIVSFVHLNGENGGTLFISAEETGMRALCSFMIGVSEDEITKEDIDDALCELVNMVAGNVNLRLGKAERALRFSTPILLNGGRMSIVTKKRVRVISRSLRNEDISLKLKIACVEG